MQKKGTTQQNGTELSWSQAAQHELFHGWQRWLSFTCIWIWSCITTELAATNETIQQLASVFAAPNEITLIASAVVLAVILAFSSRITSVVDSRSFIILAGSLLVLGSLFFAMGIFFEQLVFFVLGMLAGGANIALLKIAWGEMYSRMSVRQGLVAMGYALIASTLVVLLTKDSGQLALALLLVVVSLPCAPLVYQGTKKLTSGFVDPSLSTQPVHFSFTLLLLPAMVALSFGIVKGTMPWLDVDNSGTINTAVRYAELLSGVALVVFSYKLSKSFGAAQIYAVALIFVVAGMILFSSLGAPQWPAFFVHEIGFALFYFFMIVYWGDLARRTGMPVVRIYTIGYLTFQVAQVLGSLVGYYLVGVPSEGFALLVFLSVVLVFFIVVLLLLSASRSSLRLWLVADAYKVEQGDEVPAACFTLATKHSLSPREHEVLGLLARGRNASYVARTLYISSDTAKTHIKSIYRKVDIHTQQDLMDLIEAYVMSQNGAE